MRIRKPLHRNANTVVRVNVAPEETTAIYAVGATTKKGWKKNEDDDDGRAKASLDTVSTLSRQASLMLDGSNLSVDQLWHEEELVTRHYVRRSSNVALRNKVDEGDEEIKQEEVMSDDTKLPSASKPNPEENPSTAPEGSLLHTLYLQLLAAGSEGITLRELFTSFKKQTALPSFGSSWKEQVRIHLKKNPHFDERKGYYLLCTQLRQQPKRSPAAMKRPYMGVSPRTSSGRPVRTAFKSPVVQQQPGSNLSMENQHEGVQTRRKAYEKTIEKVLTESAKEFEKMQQMASSPGSSSGGPPDVVTTGEPTDDSPVTPSRKRKSLSENEELLEGCKTIRGSLQAMQAKIVAETGVQLGVPCARKDDARKWRCPLMAMEGHTLCDHHKSLQLRKKIRKQEEYNKKAKRRGEEDSTKLNKRRLKAEICSPGKEDNEGGAHAVEALVDLQGQLELVSLDTEAVTEDDATIEEAESEVLINQTGSLSPDGDKSIHYEKAIPGSLKALQAKIVAESGVQSGVRCARKDGSNDSARKWQCPLNAMEDHTLCEHHNFLKERKRARYAAAKQTKKTKAGARRRGNNLPESHTEFDELPPRPFKPSENLTTSRGPDEKGDHTESTDTDDNVEPAKGNAKDDDDDSNAEQLPPKAAPKRWYVAAKKTAAGSVVTKEKSQDRETSPLIRQPTIPPLPAMYGVRRKAVKNRSLLSL